MLFGLLDKSITSQLAKGFVYSGSFSVEQASAMPGSSSALLSMGEALRDYPSLVLSDNDIKRVSHGMSIEAEIEGISVLLNKSGEVAAIGKGLGSEIRPVVVFAT